MSPQFPSVGDTIMMALDIAEGRAFYLHDAAPYLGAPFIWLLALVYRVFGRACAWPFGAVSLWVFEEAHALAFGSAFNVLCDTASVFVF